MPDPKGTPSLVPEIVPFGKYKGQPAEVLLQDKKYVEWLQSQDWFRERYQSLNIFISNFGQPADTPEHNAIQVKFLSDDFRLRFALYICGNDLIALASSKLANERIDVAMAAAAEVKAERSKYRSKYRQQDDKWEVHWPSDGSSLLSIGKPVFESGGIDVAFWITTGFSVRTVGPYSDDGAEHGYTRHESFTVEIKPSIGDDFPSVLRQMRAANRDDYGRGVTHSLLYASYTGIGATEAQFREVFESSGFRVVKLTDVENVEIPYFDGTFTRVAV